MKERQSIPLVHVDIGFLADNVGQSPSNTLDGGKSKHNLLLAIDVGVEHTQNVLELLVCYQRLHINNHKTHKIDQNFERKSNDTQ